MPRRPAHVTETDVARAVRAARKTGAHSVEINVGKQATITIRIDPPATRALETTTEPGAA
jgi:hypothetical protein